MCAILRQRGKQRRNSSDSLDTTSSSEEPVSVKAGLLQTVMQELKGLLHDILRKEAKGSCPSCGADVNDRIKLEVQLHKTKKTLKNLKEI